MIAAVSKPATCERSTHYLLGKPGARLLDYSTASDRPQEIIEELNLNSARSSRVEKPFFHASLRPAPGETLSEEDWQVIGRRFLAHMGYGDCPGFVVLHTDAPQDHIHVFASRVRWTDGKVVPDSFDYHRAMDFARQIEREFGLRVVPHRTDRRTVPGPPDEDSVRRSVLAAIDRAAEGRPSVSVLVERLREQGVEVRANVASTGRVSGLSFVREGYVFKGSSLGRSYSWAGLQSKFGITYDPATDLDALKPGLSPSARPTEPTLPASAPAQPAQVAPPQPRVSAPHLSAIERAAGAHLDALGSERFTILLVRGHGNIARTWTRQQVLQSLSWLKYQNDLGARVLVRPQSASVVHLDGLDHARIERAHVSGYQPAAVVEVAPGRFEAWLKHPVQLDSRDAGRARNLLAGQFGVNANHGGFGHLAGFRAGEAPVRLDAATGDTYDNASSLLAVLRERDQTRAALAASEPTLRHELPELEMLALQNRVTVEPRGGSLQEAREAYEWSRSTAGRALVRALGDPAAEQEAIDAARTAQLARLRFELMSGVAVPQAAAEAGRIEHAARLSSALREAQDRAAFPSSNTREALRQADRASARLSVEHLRERYEQATEAAGVVRLQRLPNVNRLAAQYDQAARALDRAPDRPARLHAEITLESARYDLERAFHLMTVERQRLSERLDRLELSLKDHPRPDQVARSHARTVARAEKVESRLAQLERHLARADHQALGRDVERLVRLVSAGRRDLIDRLAHNLRELARLEPSAPRPAEAPSFEQAGRTLAASSGSEQVRQLRATAALDVARLSSEARAALQTARRDLSRAVRQARGTPADDRAAYWLASALDAHAGAESFLFSVRSRSGSGDNLKALIRDMLKGDRTPEMVEALRRALRQHARPEALAALPEPAVKTSLVPVALQARRDAAEMLRAARAASRSGLSDPRQMDRLARAVVRFQASAAEMHRSRLVLQGAASPATFARARGEALPAAVAWARQAIPKLSQGVALESLRRSSVQLPVPSGGVAAIVVGFVAGQLAKRARAATIELARGRSREQEYER